jgi:hypothetical protein
MKKDSRAVPDPTKLQSLVLLTGADSILIGGLELADAEVRSQRDVGELGGLAGSDAVGPEFVGHGCGIAPDFVHHRVFGRADDSV